MGLGTGEIEERSAIALFRHRTYINLPAGTEHDCRARPAVGKNLGDVLVPHQPIADRRAIHRRDHDVQITDRVATPTIAAGDDDAAAVAEKTYQRLGFSFSDRQLETLLVGRFSSAAESFFSIIGPNPRTWCNRAVLTRRRRSSSVLTWSLSCSTLHAPQDRQGRLITCEHGARRVTRTDHDGRITVILDQYGGKLLNSPNDVVVKSDGSVWFSDPPFGIGGNYEGNAATPELAAERLPGRWGNGSEQARSQSDLRGPNGLCFSPDETKLYVVEFGRHRTVSFGSTT